MVNGSPRVTRERTIEMKMRLTLLVGALLILCSPTWSRDQVVGNLKYYYLPG
jgi:hypothetical protein